MEAIQNTALLSQLRQLAQQAGLRGPAETAAPAGAQFGDVLQQAVKQVNHRQMKAADMARAFELEDPNVDLASVMVEGQKAKVSFEALLQVRNRLITAYQEIMNMPV